LEVLFVEKIEFIRSGFLVWDADQIESDESLEGVGDANKIEEEWTWEEVGDFIASSALVTQIRKQTSQTFESQSERSLLLFIAPLVTTS
jgi:hypothetical protein